MARSGALFVLASALVLLSRGERLAARGQVEAELAVDRSLSLQRVRMPLQWRWPSAGVLALVAPWAEASSDRFALDLDEAMDKNGDGYVDKEEFMLAARDNLDQGAEHTPFRRAVYRHAETFFDVCDVDDDGFLSNPELEYGGYLAASMSFESDDAIRNYDFEQHTADRILQLVDGNAGRVDGRIDRDEYLNFAYNYFKAKGVRDNVWGRPGARKALDKIFEKADISGDGYLNSREFQYAVYLLYDIELREVAAGMAHELDVNSNGKIERVEVEEATARLICNERVPMEKVLGLFDEADLDQDGGLDLKEQYLLAELITRDIADH